MKSGVVNCVCLVFLSDCVRWEEWIQRSVDSCLLGDLWEMTCGKIEKWNWKIDDCGISRLDLDLVWYLLHLMKSFYFCFSH